MTDPAINYTLETAKGAVILSTPDRATAVKRAELVADDYPGLKVIRTVTPPPQRFTVWTAARLRLVEVAS